MGLHQDFHPPAVRRAPAPARAPAMATASPVSPTYTDFSQSSSDFTADSIRSPLDDVFDLRAAAAYHPQQHGAPPADEFFAYTQQLPWSSPVESKKIALYSAQGFYAPVSVYVPQTQQIHAPLPSHDVHAHAHGHASALELELAAEDWRHALAPAAAKPEPAPYAANGHHHQHHHLYDGAHGVQRSYSAGAAYGYHPTHQVRASFFCILPPSFLLVSSLAPRRFDATDGRTGSQSCLRAVRRSFPPV
ncbi:hypothetical protein GGX14DRAFT_696816, partial [Mycena pura]